LEKIQKESFKKIKNGVNVPTTNNINNTQQQQQPQDDGKIKNCATVEEQVQLLLDLATSDVILTRTWIGWTPVF
jgi:hypothetical protein